MPASLAGTSPSILSYDKACSQERDHALALLSSGSVDADARRRAVLALASQAGSRPPRRAERVSRELGVALSDEAVEVRRAAASLLAWLGRAALQQRAVVAQATDDPDVAVRCWAARALANMGSDAADQMETLSNHLHDRDAAVRCLTLGALARMGDRALLQASLHATSAVDSLCDEDVEVRRAAAYAMQQLGDLGAVHAARIMAAVKDPDHEVRRMSICAMERMGELAASFCGELVDALDDRDVIVRRWVARTLEHISSTIPCQKGRLQKVAARLADPDVVVRRWLLLVFANLGHKAVQHTHAVTKALSDADEAVRCLAVGALASLGDRAAWVAGAHMSLIADAVQSSNVELRRVAALTLAIIGDNSGHDNTEEHAGHVLVLLKDPDVSVRRASARAFETLEAVASHHTAEAADALGKDDDVTVRLWLLRAVRNLGDEASAHAGLIYQILEDEREDESLRHAAAIALPHLGSEGLELWHTHRTARRKASDSLVHICLEGVWKFVQRMHQQSRGSSKVKRASSERNIRSRGRR